MDIGDIGRLHLDKIEEIVNDKATLPMVQDSELEQLFDKCDRWKLEGEYAKIKAEACQRKIKAEMDRRAQAKPDVGENVNEPQERKADDKQELQFKYDAFLSHCSKDKDTVRAIAHKLKREGLTVWFDEWQIQPGDSIPAKIEDGLERSQKLVLFMSAHATGSDWAQMEAGTFRFRDPLNKARRFVPVRLDDSEIKGSLAQFLYIDWRNDANAFAKLLAACRTQSDWPFPQDGENQEAVDHLPTIFSTQKNEWKRARADFEAEARKYHDAKLILVYRARGTDARGVSPAASHN